VELGDLEGSLFLLSLVEHTNMDVLKWSATHREYKFGPLQWYEREFKLFFNET